MAKARDALQQKMAEVRAQQPAEPVAPAPVPAAPSSPVPIFHPVPEAAPSAAPQPSPGAGEAREKAEKAARAQAQPQPKPPKPPKESPALKPSPAFKALEAPVLPISADKQQRLAELLRKYKADELTPEQYHAERAKILTE